MPSERFWDSLSLNFTVPSGDADEVVFAEYNPDDVGLTCYVLGKQANSVFDSLALEIWYDSIMKYWYDDISTVDVYTKAYNECARRIMDKPADYSGVLTTLIVVAGGIVAGRMAVLAEGDAAERDDIIYLEKLPLFDADGQPI